MDDENKEGFQYSPDQNEDSQTTEQLDNQKNNDKNKEISWIGSEFIANHKNSNWFLGFFAVLTLGVGLIFILTRDYISTASIAIVGILFALLANHKPRQLEYKIDNTGIKIGPKFYPFEHFKSFSLAQEGAIGYINLMPLKRFMPDISIYFPPEEAEKIVAMFSDHLPHHEGDERQIDKLAKKFRF